MILNGIDIGLGKVEAYYSYISFYSKDLKNSITLGFNKKINFNELKINETLDITNYFYFDVSFQKEDIYYLFFLPSSSIKITKLENELYSLDIDIIVNKEDQIYSEDETYSFKNLKINVDVKFGEAPKNKEYNPKIVELLKKDVKKPNNFFEVLDKL